MADAPFTPPHLLDAHRWAGMRVGLLGGSFNPPHEGHVHISLAAMKMLSLDAVWWMVSPGNPMKPSAQNAPYETRLSWCADMLEGHPRLITTDIEGQLGTTRTVDTLSALLPRFGGTEFVFLAGMDNALILHKWHGWQAIPQMVALAFIGRPPARQMIRNCPLRMLHGQKNVILQRQSREPLSPNHTFWIMGGPLNTQSSTALRAA